MTLRGMINGARRNTSPLPLRADAFSTTGAGTLDGFSLDNIELVPESFSYDDGVFLAGAQASILRSVDGRNWDLIPLNTDRVTQYNARILGITRFQNVWIGHGEQGLLLGSGDGSSWYPLGSQWRSDVDVDFLASTVRANEFLLIGVDDDETLVVCAGTLQENWSLETSFELGDKVRQVLFTDDRILVRTDDANWISSDNGRSFTMHATPSTVRTVAALPKAFVWQLDDGGILTSSDGVTWSAPRDVTFKGPSGANTPAVPAEVWMAGGQQRLLFANHQGRLYRQLDGDSEVVTAQEPSATLEFESLGIPSERLVNGRPDVWQTEKLTFVKRGTSVAATELPSTSLVNQPPSWVSFFEGDEGVRPDYGNPFSLVKHEPISGDTVFTGLVANRVVRPDTPGGWRDFGASGPDAFAVGAGIVVGAEALTGARGKVTIFYPGSDSAPREQVFSNFKAKTAVYSSGRFYLFSETGQLMVSEEVSTDATELVWQTPFSIVTDEAEPKSVAVFNDRIYVVFGTMLYVSSGENPTSASDFESTQFPLGFSLYRLVSGDERIIAIGGKDRLLSISVDGMTFSEPQQVGLPGPGQLPTRYRFAGGRFFGIRNSSTFRRDNAFWTSTDGIEWTRIESPFPWSVVDVTATADDFIFVGGAASVLRISKDALAAKAGG